MFNNKVVTIMDGSMGRQLQIEGLPSTGLFLKIWSASALADPSFHKMVVNTHQRYIRAGAKEWCISKRHLTQGIWGGGVNEYLLVLLVMFCQNRTENTNFH